MFIPKKGVSPVIATVLLIAITILPAALIFTFSKTTLESFSSPINCQDISFEAGIVEDSLDDPQKILEINNLGKDLAGFEIKVYDSSTDSIDKVRVEEEVQSGKADQISVDLSLQPAEGADFSNYEFLIVPLIKKDNKVLTCTDESGVPAQIQVISQAQPVTQCNDRIDNDGDGFCDYVNYICGDGIKEDTDCNGDMNIDDESGGG